MTDQRRIKVNHRHPCRNLHPPGKSVCCGLHGFSSNESDPCKGRNEWPWCKIHHQPTRRRPLVLRDETVTSLPENVLLGLRPEDIGDAELRKGRKLQISSCHMDVVEPAGAGTYVLMSLDGKQVTARLQAETARSLAWR